MLVIKESRKLSDHNIISPFFKGGCVEKFLKGGAGYGKR